MPLFDRIPSPPLEAIQWTGDNHDEVVAFAGQDNLCQGMEGLELWCGVDGGQGWVPVPVAHWIAKGVPAHLYPIDAEYFAAHFTPHQED